MSKTAFSLHIDNSNPFKATRHTWGVLNPVTRVVPNKRKANDRKSAKSALRKAIMG